MVDAAAIQSGRFCGGNPGGIFVRDFLDQAGELLDLDWKQYVEIDPRYLRPTEVDSLLGDSSKAQAQLGWRPRVKFPQLVRMMVEHDLELAKQERTLREAGHTVFPCAVPL